MKKAFALVLFLLSASFLGACGKTTLVPTERALPVFSGVEDVTIEAGSVFKSLLGVRAVDQEGKDVEIVVSGLVDPNSVGEYVLTYTATDDQGKTQTALRTVKVIRTDKTAPLLTGVGDKTIVVGQSFDKEEGVSAIDNIDKDVTSKIEITGEVDIYTPGEYIVNYSVKDEAENIATKERKVVVSLGEFKFFEENVKTENVVSGNINVLEYGHGIIKVKVNASAQGEGTVGISGFNGLERVQLKEGENVVYLAYPNPENNTSNEVALPANLSVVVTGCTFVSYTIAKPLDITAPVVSFNNLAFDNETIYLPNKLNGLALTDTEINEILFTILSPSAKDNRDGNIPCSLLTEIDRERTTVQQVQYGAEDDAGNEGSKAIDIQFVEPVAVDDMRPGNLIDEFITNLANLGKKEIKLQDIRQDDTILRYMENATIENDPEGNTLIKNTSFTGYYYSNKLQFLFGQDVSFGNYYAVSITIKAAAQDRDFMLRFYQGVNQDPWSADFLGQAKVTRTARAAEFTTYNFVFKYTIDPSDIYGTICEMDFGPFNYGTLAEDNHLVIKDFTVYALGGTVNSPYVAE